MRAAKLKPHPPIADDRWWKDLFLFSVIYAVLQHKFGGGVGIALNHSHDDCSGTYNPPDFARQKIFLSEKYRHASRRRVTLLKSLE